VHQYQGASALEAAWPARVTAALGCPVLIVTNACGGVSDYLSAGDIVLNSDHINLTGANPLCGPNEERWGPRFPDMSRVYDPALGALAGRKAREIGFELRRGVYTGLRGPSL
jgi:purine-nucleoside phosphorylase